MQAYASLFQLVLTPKEVVQHKEKNICCEISDICFINYCDFGQDSKLVWVLDDDM
jgi:hypothetical protein